MMDCKKALQESDNDIDKAVDYLRQQGKSKAAKRAARDASEGVVYSYIHPGDKIGVLVEINCETDFVARTDDFKGLVKEVAMQIAAADPRWLSRDEVTDDDLEREKSVIKTQLEDEGKPENIIDKIIEGKLGKFYSENCLIDQPYIRDDKKSVSDLVQDTIAKVGENIQISRFVRYEVGK